MKNTFLLIGLTAILFSCKKKEDNNFEAQDMTGNTVVEGIATKQVGGNTTPVSGAVVTVKIKNSGSGGLYPGSSAVGSEVYTGSTDANGRYSINVKTNGTGVNSEITFKGFTAKNDTAIAAIVYDYPTTMYSQTLYKGVNFTQNHAYAGTPLVTPSNQGMGTAMVTGSVYKPTWVHAAATGAATYSVNFPAANRVVYLEYDKDPMTLTKKIYTTTTDASGRYSFTISTPNMGITGFANAAKVYTNDWATTNDTVKFTGGVNTGKPGVFPGGTLNASGVYSTVIKNAQNFGYMTFVND
jgi:hypothetical protein